jgi:hypothetical protein
MWTYFAEVHNHVQFGIILKRVMQFHQKRMVDTKDSIFIGENRHFIQITMEIAGQSPPGDRPDGATVSPHHIT